MLLRFLLLAGLLLSTAANADSFCVGRATDPFSTHTTIAGAVAAAAANGPGEDSIRLDGTFTHVVPDTLEIKFQSVAIVGGFANCQAFAPTTVSTISGAGGTAGSVLKIGDPNTAAPTKVTFFLVVITGGEDDGTGGGLHLEGPNLTVGLEAGTSVRGNTATLGGGIYNNGAVLTLASDTYIENNTATDGGGVYCRGGTGNVGMIAANDNSVQFNQASNNGGGYALFERCRLLATGGSSISVVLNRAGRDGGGIYAGVQAVVEARRGADGGTDPVPFSDTFQINLNTAGANGGGVALHSYAHFTGWGIAINNNKVEGSSGPASVQVPRGGGVHVGVGSVLQLLHDPHCPPDEPCNRVEDNRTDRPNFSAYGAGIAGNDCLQIELENLRLRGNSQLGVGPNRQGAALSAQQCGNLALRQVLMHGNSAATASSVLDAQDTPAQIYYTTIAGNQLPGGSYVLNASGGANIDLVLRSSILYQPFMQFALLTGAMGRNVDCVLGHNLFDYVPNAQRSFDGSPGFVDAPNGDFRATPGALQVDKCDGPLGVPLDLDGRPRQRDLAVADVYGSIDLGAYELQEPVERIFYSGFELVFPTP